MLKKLQKTKYKKPTNREALPTRPCTRCEPAAAHGTSPCLTAWYALYWLPKMWPCQRSETPVAADDIFREGDFHHAVAVATESPRCLFAAVLALSLGTWAVQRSPLFRRGWQRCQVSVALPSAVLFLSSSEWEEDACALAGQAGSQLPGQACSALPGSCRPGNIVLRWVILPCGIFLRLSPSSSLCHDLRM